MKTLNIEDLSPESAKTVVEALDIITETDLSVQIKIDGKTAYSVIREDQSLEENILNDTTDDEKMLFRKYAPALVRMSLTQYEES